MKKFWRGVGNVLAVLLSMLFVVTMVAAVVLYNIDSRLLNARTYKTVLVGQQVYARLPRIVAEQLTISMAYNPCRDNPFLCENPDPEFKDCVIRQLGEERYKALLPGNQSPTNAEKQRIQPCVDQYLSAALNNAAQNGPPDFIKSLNSAEWETILTQLFPGTELRTTVENMLDQVFAYMNGQQDSVNLSLGNFKERLSGQDGVNAMLDLIRAQPLCNGKESDDMLASLHAGTAPAVFCNPPPEKLQEAVPDIQKMMIAAAGALPDQKMLLSQDPAANTAGNPPVSEGFRMAHLVLRLSPELPLGLLMIMTLLMVRTPRTWMRWWGIPAFFAGLLIVLVAISSAMIFEQIWLGALASRIPAYLSLGTVELARGVANALVRKLTNGILFGGLLLGLGGLALWIGSSFVKNTQDEPPSEAPAV